MKEQFKIQFKLHKVLYPYDNGIQLGGFSIVSCIPFGASQFEPRLKLNKYHNFTLTCESSPIFNFLDVYTAVVEETNHPKYGIGYRIVSMDMDNFELTDNGKIAFLREILTPNQFEALTSYFDDPFTPIAKGDIETLCSCKGVGKKTAQ